MEERRLLGTYRIKNISGRNIEFVMTLEGGRVVGQTIADGEVIRGVNRHGINLLSPWIDYGDIIVEQEWQWVASNKHDWSMEGF